MSRWIAMHCSEETEELQARHPNAFLLLCQIARRAKWKDCAITGLKAGEAWIGDWDRAGLHSKKAYEVAKSRLEKCKLVAFQGGNRGTRATLLNSEVFSVSDEAKGKPEGEQRGNKGEAEGKQGGTNHTDTQKHGHTDTPNEPERKPISFNGDDFENITGSDYDRWEELAPNVDADFELASAAAWLSDNPTKHPKSFSRFLLNWMRKAQKRAINSSDPIRSKSDPLDKYELPTTELGF